MLKFEEKPYVELVLTGLNSGLLGGKVVRYHWANPRHKVLPTLTLLTHQTFLEIATLTSTLLICYLDFDGIAFATFASIEYMDEHSVKS